MQNLRITKSENYYHMSDPSSFETLLGTQSNEILDLLPFGISIQDKHFRIIYENEAVKQLVGSFKGHNCYERWTYLDDYSGYICNDCPSTVVFRDKKSHKIVRKTENQYGVTVYLEITHIPIMGPDNDVNRFIEIIRDVTYLEKTRLLDLEDRTNVFKELYLGICNFGKFGGELLITENVDIFSENPKSFYTNLSAFWFAAIGQGNNWQKGLFGPLPLLDQVNYVSYSYAFNLANPNADSRLQDNDYIILIIITRKENGILFDQKQKIGEFFERFFDNYTSVEDLNSEILEELRSLLFRYIDTVIDFY